MIRDPSFFGGNASTQSNSGVVTRGGKIIWKGSVNYADAGLCSKYGMTPGGFVAIGNGAYYAHPGMIAESLERLFHKMLSELGRAEMGRIAAGKILAMQHGTTWANRMFRRIITRLHEGWRPAYEKVLPGLSLPTPLSPIWMHKATVDVRRAMEEVMPPKEWAEAGGARVTERFPAPQTRRLVQLYPRHYGRTTDILWWHTFLTSLLTGKIAPVGYGDGFASNWADIRSRKWRKEALRATARNLGKRLPALVHPDTFVGHTTQYWVDLFGFDPRCEWYASDGDNNGSVVGAGVRKPGQVVLSIGSSITLLCALAAATYDPELLGIVMAMLTGDYMAMLCQTNGGLCIDKVRKDLGLSWAEFNQLLASTDVKNGGKHIKPFLVDETTPNTGADWRLIGMESDKDPACALAVVQALIANLKYFAAFIGDITSIIGTGGGATQENLQVAADIFGVDVFPGEKDTVALGAAMGAEHGYYNGERSWDEIVEPLCTLGKAITPRSEYREFYDQLVETSQSI